jgi:hypothetical protein
MRFRATLQQSGKTATGIEVPAKVVEALGAGKRPPVRATINGYTYRSSIASLGGVYMLSVSAEVRERAGVAAGNVVDVDVELDTAPREVAVPDDLAQALKQDAAAKRFFEGLSYSNQRRLVMAIDAAKTAETRQRRIAQTVEKLRAGKA